MPDEDQSKPTRRNEKSRRAILDAALHLARHNGYAKLSIEAIAERAGVGKQTIYRWWPSKGAVVLDAFIDFLEPQLEWTEHDNLTDQLASQLGRVRDVLSNPATGPHISGLVGEAQRDPIVAERFREHVVVPYRNLTVSQLEQAQQQGDLGPDVDLTLLADALFAPLWFRLLVGAAPVSTFDPDAHVRQLLAGVGPITS